MPNWITSLRRTSAATTQLLCCHYAGGSARYFLSWLPLLHGDIDVLAVQLPGREGRYAEPLAEDMLECVTLIRRELDQRPRKPLLLFGHSMGAIVAHELAVLLQAEGDDRLRHLFVSGRRAPSAKRPLRMLHALPDQQFIDEIRRLDGTPQELFDEPELLAFVLPAIRADFRLTETYRPATQRRPLHVPITAYAGATDAYATVDEVAAWSEETIAGFALHRLDGGHFAITKHARRITRDINITAAGTDHRANSEQAQCLAR